MTFYLLDVNLISAHFTSHNITEYKIPYLQINLLNWLVLIQVNL